MKLSGSQFHQIQDAFLDGFSSLDELRMMVRIELEENLSSIVDGGNLRVVIFNLIVWAERHDRVNDLILGASHYIPGNAKIASLSQQVKNGSRAIDATIDQETSEQFDVSKVDPTSIDVFLCYSHEDADTVNTVQEILRSTGISVWSDEGLEAGTPNWQEVVEEAIKQAACVIAVLSPDAKTSRWVSNELSVASRLDKRVLPILVRGNEDTSIPLVLASTQFVDARQDLHTSLSHVLIPALERTLNRQSAETVDIAVRIPKPDVTTGPGADNVLSSDAINGLGSVSVEARDHMSKARPNWLTLGIGSLFMGVLSGFVWLFLSFAVFAGLAFLISDGPFRLREASFLTVSLVGFLAGMGFGVGDHLGRYLPQRQGFQQWRITTSCAWAIIGVAAGLILIFRVGIDNQYQSYPNEFIVPLVLVMAGTMGGVAQWKLLRKMVPRAFWWIVANFLGWTTLAGFTVVFGSTGIDFWGWLRFMLGILLGVMGYTAIVGLTFCRLFELDIPTPEVDNLVVNGHEKV
ncbi:MAG: TIR domain-containing protein [Caldilinea sp.]|nr:TIR domain-containing protein [Caldilineaceae bacterium]MCO5212910.1 TIR domain-containing protein [Caldilinea sp.]